MIWLFFYRKCWNRIEKIWRLNVLDMILVDKNIKVLFWISWRGQFRNSDEVLCFVNFTQKKFTTWCIFLFEWRGIIFLYTFCFGNEITSYDNFVQIKIRWHRFFLWKRNMYVDLKCICRVNFEFWRVCET